MSTQAVSIDEDRDNVLNPCQLHTNPRKVFVRGPNQSRNSFSPPSTPVAIPVPRVRLCVCQRQKESFVDSKKQVERDDRLKPPRVSYRFR